MLKTLTKFNLFSEEHSSDAERVLLLPGYLFVVESIPLTGKLSHEELESLALLTLESITPFTIEQLHWGYVSDAGGNHLLLFAAYRERAGKAGYGTLENFRQVYPDFLCLSNTGNSQPATHILNGPEGWVAASFEPEARFPVHVAAIAHPVEDEGSSLPDEKSRDRLIPEILFQDMDREKYPVGKTVEGNVRTRVVESGVIQFLAETGESVPLPPEQVWCADLRPLEFGEKIRKQRKRERILWKAVSFAAMAAIILLVLEGVHFAGERVNRIREDKIAAQAVKVAQLGSRNDLVNRLELRSTGRLRPFRTLEIMNRSRPETLYFTDIEAGDVNRFTIEGIASNPNEVNDYADSLRETDYFDSVIQQNRRVVSGQVNFTLQLVVNELPSNQAASTQEPESAPAS